MPGLAFTCIHPWTAEGETFEAGTHQIDDPAPGLVRAASHAHAAGVLQVTDGLDVTDVQSQEDGEAALADAMGEWVEAVRDENGKMIEPGYWTGPWHQANLDLHELIKDQPLVIDVVEPASDAEPQVEPEQAGDA